MHTQSLDGLAEVTVAVLTVLGFFGVLTGGIAMLVWFKNDG